MFALDFVSLLLSKDTPVQASLTISPQLRELVGMGTVGADKLHVPRITDAQKQDNKQIAKGWKAQSLNTTVDSILASATRLEKEIELETKYTYAAAGTYTVVVKVIDILGNDTTKTMEVAVK